MPEPTPVESVTVEDLAELQNVMLAQRERLDVQERRVDELVEHLRLCSLAFLGLSERIRPESGSGEL